MVIGPVDKATTSSMNASKKRKLKDSSSIRQQATNLDDTVTMASSTFSSASDSENSRAAMPQFDTKSQYRALN